MNSINLPNKLLTIGKNEISKENFKPIETRYDFIKPNGGIWTSPYTPNKDFYSAWHEWCTDNDYCKGLSNDGVLIKLKDDVLFYCINSQKDLIDLIEIVGEKKSEIDKIVGYCMWKMPDWEMATKICDVIYLTEKGMQETHLPVYNREYNLYGWDCETCLILNYDCIESWEYKKLDIIK